VGMCSHEGVKTGKRQEIHGLRPHRWIFNPDYLEETRCTEKQKISRRTFSTGH
jgi:hypothetical protein